MTACCIEGCDGPGGDDPVFFDFPTSRLLRKRWSDAISAPIIPQDAVICIRHFASEDYELIRGKARLKNRVVPTLSVRDNANNDDDTEESQESTDTATSDITSCTNDQKVINNENNHNGNNKDNGNNNHNNDGKIEHNSTRQCNKDQKRIVSGCDENNENTNSSNKQTLKDNSKRHKNNDGSYINIEKDDSITGDYKNNIDNKLKVHNDNENLQMDIAKVDNDNGKCDNDNRKLDNDNVKVNNTKESKNDDSKENHVNFSKDVNIDNVKVNTDTSDKTGSYVESDDKKEENYKEADKDVENKDKNAEKDNKNLENDDKNEGRDDKIVESDDKNNENVRNRKTRCKITAKRARRRISISENSDTSSLDSVSSSPLPPPLPPPPELEGSKDDIEGILTHYYIENKKTERQVAAMTDVLQEERREERSLGGKEDADGFRGFEQEPVFIELSVGQGYSNYSGCPPQPGGENDCLMVLESVQCDVDPALLLAAREDEEVEQVDLGDDDEDDDGDDEPVVVEKKKEDPISLLTSSDEDDVILQEPKIDTVEVSSAETSEDDMPLVALVKKKSHKTKKSAILNKVLWGRNGFYCVHCRFSTHIGSEYTKHMATHSKVLQMCQNCGFTTCSKAQLQRHKQKHKNERRFQCKLCTYSAKHRMSLVYHMKTHNNARDVELAICGTFEPSSRLSVHRKASGNMNKSKVKNCDKRHMCESCDYKTNRFSDLRRHRRRIHKADSDDDDDEYKP